MSEQQQENLELWASQVRLWARNAVESNNCEEMRGCLCAIAYISTRPLSEREKETGRQLARSLAAEKKP